MKKCNECGETKPLDEFQVRSANKDGRTGKCKACKRRYDNTHYKNNPERREYIRENSMTRIEKVRTWVIDYLLSHPCVDCGETDIVVLEFDHQRDKEFGIGLMLRSYKLERIIAEVEKCEVRCCNCHRRKTAKDFGWYRVLFEMV